MLFANFGEFVVISIAQAYRMTTDQADLPCTCSDLPLDGPAPPLLNMGSVGRAAVNTDHEHGQCVQLVS